MEYVLTTEGLTKQYRNFKALGGLSMHVEKGAIYGFVGRNGAGKTTLIRLICGLQTPTSGTYTLYGKKNTEGSLSRERRRMGAVVETPSIYGSMTAEENLKQQYRVLGRPSFDGIKELLELVGLKDTGKKKAKNFSLGMKQRLGLALAIMHSPEFLVLDEPINGLDPEGIIEIRSLLQKINSKKNVTILISSHILPELSSIATRYGFLKNGVLLEELSAQELLRKCSVYVELQVSDVKKASVVLETRLGIRNYQVYPDGYLHVFEKLDQVDQICREVVLADIGLFSAHKQAMDLESYYVNLMGGTQ